MIAYVPFHRSRLLVLPFLFVLAACGAQSTTRDGTGGDGTSADGQAHDGMTIDGPQPTDVPLDQQGDAVATDTQLPDVPDDTPAPIDTVTIDAVTADTATTDTVVTDTATTDTVTVDVVATDTVVAVDVVTVDAADVLAADVPLTCSGSMSCYVGPAGTLGVGVCLAGTRQCIGTAYGPCIGEVDPTPEACNGVDDNCNGSTDENLGTIQCGIGACQRTAPSCVGGRPGTCTPGTPASETCGDGIDNNCNGSIDEGCACVAVAPTGSDTTGTGSATAPFRTIAHAIASAGTGGLPNIVCAASGATCPSTFDYSEVVVMRNGVHVYGGYQATGASWPRVATCVTRIIDQDARGVYFDAAVSASTVIDGFTINGHNEIVNAAVTVQGSRGAVITNNVVNGGSGTTSYGIDIMDSGGAATPRISSDTIVGGTGTAMAVGVHSLRSAPVVTNNCATFDAMGRCTSGACGNAIVRGIRARPPASTLGGGESYGVRLESSPGTLLDTSAVCAQGLTSDAAAVRVSGDATGTVVRANNLFGGGSNTNAVGFWADACAGAAPWVVNNSLIMGNSPVHLARADGVRAVGDCHPVVDSNVRIVGGVESAQNDANGVYCARDALTGLSSRCTVLNNALIQGSGGGYPPRAVGVRCDDGACARIENNASITGNSGVLSYGIVLGATGTFVNANHIESGCGLTEGNGILTQNAFARIQNNVIGGNLCAASGAAPPVSGFAVQVLLSSGLNEVDLHSNDLLARGVVGTCTSRALAFDVMPGATLPTGPLGIVRNNIFHPGLCNTRYDLIEMNAAADPRIVANNDFYFQAAGDVLYRDEAATNLTTLATIGALTDITVAANLSIDPLWSATNHLMVGSPCIDTGTVTGGPGLDIDGQTRPFAAGFDVGADEFHP